MSCREWISEFVNWVFIAKSRRVVCGHSFFGRGFAALGSSW
jgi:hypothetical protein